MNNQIFVSNEQNTNTAAESMLNAADLWEEEQEILRGMAEEEIARENGFFFYMEIGYTFDEARGLEIDSINQQISALQNRLCEIMGEQ